MSTRPRGPVRGATFVGRAEHVVEHLVDVVTRAVDVAERDEWAGLCGNDDGRPQGWVVPPIVHRDLPAYAWTSAFLRPSMSAAPKTTRLCVAT